VRLFCLLLVVVCCCFGQETPKWIHSDAVDDPVKVGSMLEKICPGCQICPEGSARVGERWEVRSIFLGHFLSPLSEDALVSGFGCESHADSWGGSILLTKAQSSWRQIRYVPGMIAYDCKKLTGSDGRDRLACGNSDAHQGYAYSRLYLIDPAAVSSDVQGVEFFRVEDTMGAGENLRETGIIDRVTFTNLAAKNHVHICCLCAFGASDCPRLGTCKGELCSGPDREGRHGRTEIWVHV
jgi:hypothetical protein